MASALAAVSGTAFLAASKCRRASIIRFGRLVVFPSAPHHVVGGAAKGQARDRATRSELRAAAKPAPEVDMDATKRADDAGDAPPGRREKATVVSVPGRDSMVITFSISGRQFNLNRSKEEDLGKCLARIQQNALKAARKSDHRPRGRGRGRSKARSPEAADEAPPQQPAPGNQEPPALEVALFDNEAAQGPPIPDGTPNEAAWERGQVLQVGAVLWDILHNIPTVEQMSLPGRCIVGVPVVPTAQILFADPDVCRWRWWRRPGGLHKRHADEDDGWQLVEGFGERIYTPTAEDRGCLLRAECLPARREAGPSRTDIGAWCSADSSSAVEEGPPLSSGAKRHPLTPRPLAAAEGFRVITYNVLADQYVRFEKNRPDEKRRDLFPFCANQFLDPDYRKQLIAEEVLGFHPDIVCMQEVDYKLFSGYYQPYLSSMGFEGIYTRKAGKIDEGCALFVRRSRFSIASTKDVELRQLFKAPLQEGMERFAPLLDASPRLRKALHKVSTIAQLAILTPVDPEDGAAQDRPLVLANTHLFFHPGAGNIRTVHTATIVDQAVRFAGSWAQAHESLHTPTLVFCGDLNSDLNDEEGVCGAVQLLADGHLAQDHWEWAARCGFDWDAARNRGGEAAEEAAEEDAGESSRQGSEAFPLGTVMDEDMGDAEAISGAATPSVTGVDLELPCPVASADGLASDFTNYVRGYQALLDYVWLQSDALRAERFIPLPSLAEVEGFCPSPRWPSDHISVVADLQWLPPAEDAVAPADGDRAARVPGAEYILPAELCNATKGAAPLMQDGILAVPTDTLYGLACCANSTVGIERIYQAKGRPKSLPLAICVAEPSEVALYGDATHLPPGILDDLLPGPTTVILRRLEDARLSPSLNPGVGTIGIRVPDSPFIRGICGRLGRAIALTSANVSGAKSSIRIDHFQELWGRCDVVFDGGEIFAPPVGSTIIDLSHQGHFRILRKGINHEHYADLLGSKWSLLERTE